MRYKMAISALSKRLGALTVALLVVSTIVGHASRLEHVRAGRDNAPAALSDNQTPVSADRLALVVGTYGYPDADIPPVQVRRDAEALSRVLRKDGFAVDLVENATRADMIRAIERLKERVRPHSIVFLYFGGYGVQSGDQDYMVPVDAKIWRERDVRQQGVSLERTLSDLRQGGAIIRIAVVDASRRNPFERRFRSYSHGLKLLQLSENALVLTSSGPDQVVEDSDTAESPFMAALVHEMESSAHPIKQIFEDTRRAVAARTGNQQVPTVSSTLREAVNLGWPPIEAPISSVAEPENRRRG
jgi:uncharacterized caspase-like protein